MCIGPTAANGTRPRQRQTYFVIARQKLAYLDLIEKANCVHSLSSGWHAFLRDTDGAFTSINVPATDYTQANGNQCSWPDRRTYDYSAVFCGDSGLFPTVVNLPGDDTPVTSVRPTFPLQAG